MVRKGWGDIHAEEWSMHDGLGVVAHDAVFIVGKVAVSRAEHRKMTSTNLRNKSTVFDQQLRRAFSINCIKNDEKGATYQ